MKRIDVEELLIKSVHSDFGIPRNIIWERVNKVAEGIVIAKREGFPSRFLLVFFRPNWRCIGRITDMTSVLKCCDEPIEYFREAWYHGADIDTPFKRKKP